MGGERASKSRLAQSAYLSPYSHDGAPAPHPNSNPYAILRERSLSTLEAMGYDPSTMVERGVVWAEDQDPFGHMMNSQYSHFFSTCFHRVMESFDEYLSKQEYDDMINGRNIIPVIQGYEFKIRRPVIYPDSLIAAHRHEKVDPTRDNGITSLFSLKQQTIVAEVRGNVTFLDTKTGRAKDIRTAGDGWMAVYDGLTKKAERSAALQEKWNREHPRAEAGAEPTAKAKL